MDTTGTSKVRNDEMPSRSMPLVLGALAFAIIASFIVTSFREYGGFNYAGHFTSLSNAIIGSIGAAFIFPVIHLAIASLWKTKRNSRSRRNIFFGWGVAVGIIQIFNVTQVLNFRQSKSATQPNELVAAFSSPQFEVSGIKLGDSRESVLMHLPNLYCDKGALPDSEQCSGRGPDIAGGPQGGAYMVRLSHGNVQSVVTLMDTNHADNALAMAKLKYGAPDSEGVASVDSRDRITTWTDDNGQQLEFVRGEGEPAFVLHRAPSHVATVADPNQSMEGSYCDRLAAVGKSMVNGRNKGTQRTTIETSITNTAEISENERVVYRQMTQVVYDDPSLTEAAMYERTHKACEETVAELTEAAESDRG